MTNEELIKAIRKGNTDNDLIMELWNQNSGIVRKACKKYSGYIDLEDAQQECFIAYLFAIKDYDLKSNQTFVGYLYNRCRWHLQRYVFENGSVIRIPVHQKELILRYKKFVREWYQLQGTLPKDFTIRSNLDINQKQLEWLKKDLLTETVRSADIPLDDDGEETLWDTLPDTSQDVENGTVEVISDRQRKSALWGAVDALREKDGEAIRLYYRDRMTYKQIGEAVGVSPERVRQRIARGLRQLRKDKNKKILRDYIDDSTIYSKAITGGVETFNRTWTSSTENTALWKLEKEGELRGIEDQALDLQNRMTAQKAL